MDVLIINSLKPRTSTAIFDLKFEKSTLKLLKREVKFLKMPNGYKLPLPSLE